jgi:gliding motility-associated-like protein
MRIKHQIYCLFLFFTCLKGFSQSDIGGEINIYKPVVSIKLESCASTITVTNVNGLNEGDQILLIQMKGAILNETNTKDFGSVIDYNGAGNYEIAIIKSINNNKLITNKLSKKYDATNGKVQVVSFPKYSNAVVTSKVQAQTWNGTTGGVVALNITGSLTLKADIDVSGQGFSGGRNSKNPDGACGSGSPDYYYPLNQSGFSWQKGGAEKGEGIGNLSSDKIAGKGAAANGGGGGNKHNHGGGGGSNFTTGGKGGDGLQGCFYNSNGGGGGWALISNVNKLFLGGGGGCGDDNNRVGTVGASGGGIIIILASEIIGNGYYIKANGAHQTDDGYGIADGAGGGGGGGSILLDIKNFNSVLNIEVNGGNGGNQNPTFGCVGPGGGGGTGIMMSCNKNIPSSVIISKQPGKAGIIKNGSLSNCANTTYGATNGDANPLRYLIIDSCLKFPEPISSLSNTYDTAMCDGDSLTLKANLQDASYTWSDSSTNSTLIVKSPGKYWVKTTASTNCITVDTINVGLTPDFLLNLGNDTIACEGVPFTLRINDSQLNILWDNGTNNIFREITSPGLYNVTVSNKCYKKYDSIRVDFEECDCSILLPNAFSPNNDGINEIFAPSINCPILEYYFLIFDRWGEVLFKSTNINNGWNGLYKGEKVPAGVYFYILSYKYPRGTNSKKGSLILLPGK